MQQSRSAAVRSRPQMKPQKCHPPRYRRTCARTVAASARPVPANHVPHANKPVATATVFSIPH